MPIIHQIEEAFLISDNERQSVPSDATKRPRWISLSGAWPLEEKKVRRGGVEGLLPRDALRRTARNFRRNQRECGIFDIFFCNAYNGNVCDARRLAAHLFTNVKFLHRMRHTHLLSVLSRDSEITTPWSVTNQCVSCSYCFTPYNHHVRNTLGTHRPESGLTMHGGPFTNRRTKFHSRMHTLGRRASRCESCLPKRA